MILKIQNCGKDNYDVWDYFDDIYNVCVQFDESVGKTVATIVTNNFNTPIKLIIKNCAYILSDKGYIIDRISAHDQDTGNEEKAEVLNEVR